MALKNIDKFILENEQAVTDLCKNCPADMRSAIREFYRRMHEAQTPKSIEKPD